MTNKLPDMNQFAVEYLDLASKYEKLHKEYPLITEAYGVKVAPLSIDRSESMIYDFSYQYQDEYSSCHINYEDLDVELLGSSELEIIDLFDYDIPKEALTKTPNEAFELFVQNLTDIPSVELKALFEEHDVKPELVAIYRYHIYNTIQNEYSSELTDLKKKYPNLPFYPATPCPQDYTDYYEPSTC